MPQRNERSQANWLVVEGLRAAFLPEQCYWRGFAIDQEEGLDKLQKGQVSDPPKAKDPPHWDQEEANLEKV